MKIPFSNSHDYRNRCGLLLLSAGCGRLLTRPRKHRHFSLNPIAKPILLDL
jgi:hypothetical protein